MIRVRYGLLFQNKERDQARARESERERERESERESARENSYLVCRVSRFLVVGGVVLAVRIVARRAEVEIVPLSRSLFSLSRSLSLALSLSFALASSYLLSLSISLDLPLSKVPL